LAKHVTKNNLEVTMAAYSSIQIVEERQKLSFPTSNGSSPITWEYADYIHKLAGQVADKIKNNLLEY